MFYSEKDLKDTLSKDIEISKTVEQRLQDTYGQIRSKQRMSGKKHRRSRGINAAAAAAAAVILLSGTTAGAAYLSAHTDLLNHVFGQEGRRSKEAYEKTVPDGKGGEVTVTMPGKEYVGVDDDQAERLAEPYVQELNIVRQIGDYTLTVIDNMTDGSAGVMSLKLECEDGIRALKADQERNDTKGAYFTDDRDFYFILEDAQGEAVAEKTIIDAEKSTDTCYYLYSSYVCNNLTDSLKLHLEQYDKPVSEWDISDEAGIIMEEDIPVTLKNMPLTEIENPDNGESWFAYSAISLSLNLSNSFGLDEYVDDSGEGRFVDPYYVKYIALEYKDGSRYVVSDEENGVDNTNYVCGGMGENQDVLKLVFNRMVDWSQVENLVVNEIEIPIGE